MARSSAASTFASMIRSTVLIETLGLDSLLSQAVEEIYSAEVRQIATHIHLRLELYEQCARSGLRVDWKALDHCGSVEGVSLTASLSTKRLVQSYTERAMHLEH